MHAHLIVGKDDKAIEAAAKRIADKSGSDLLPFSLQKIADVRELQSLTKLTLAKPTTFFLKDVDTATIDALNAFLKNLEEPQKNANYVLTASSIYKVLPTVVSRCTVIKLHESTKGKDDPKVKAFLEKTPGDRLAYLAGIKGKEDALAFIESFINYTHSKLLQSPEKQQYVHHLLAAESTRQALFANGNPTLQLTNFAVSLKE